MKNKILACALLVLLAGCAAVEATGEGIEAVGEGTGRAISGTGEAIADTVDDDD